MLTTELSLECLPQGAWRLGLWDWTLRSYLRKELDSPLLEVGELHGNAASFCKGQGSLSPGEHVGAMIPGCALGAQHQTPRRHWGFLEVSTGLCVLEQGTNPKKVVGTQGPAQCLEKLVNPSRWSNGQECGVPDTKRAMMRLVLHKWDWHGLSCSYDQTQNDFLKCGDVPTFIRMWKWHSCLLCGKYLCVYRQLGIKLISPCIPPLLLCKNTHMHMCSHTHRHTPPHQHFISETNLG